MGSGLAIATICFLLAVVHDSTAKAKPSSKFLLIEMEDSGKKGGRKRREGGKDYTDPSEPVTGGRKYGML